jgi:hypothetical protein
MYSVFDSQYLWNKVTYVVTILAQHCLHVSRECRAYLQQDGAPPHYHRLVRAYLDDTLPGRWIGRRGATVSRPNISRLLPMGNLEG